MVAISVAVEQNFCLRAISRAWLREVGVELDATHLRQHSSFVTIY
jgi:hypothetical protein